jgi:hypothetical protein
MSALVMTPFASYTGAAAIDMGVAVFDDIDVVNQHRTLEPAISRDFKSFPSAWTRLGK